MLDQSDIKLYFEREILKPGSSLNIEKTNVDDLNSIKWIFDKEIKNKNTNEDR